MSRLRWFFIFCARLQKDRPIVSCYPKEMVAGRWAGMASRWSDRGLARVTVVRLPGWGAWGPPKRRLEATGDMNWCRNQTGVLHSKSSLFDGFPIYYFAIELNGVSRSVLIRRCCEVAFKTTESWCYFTLNLKIVKIHIDRSEIITAFLPSPQDNHSTPRRKPNSFCSNPHTN